MTIFKRQLLPTYFQWLISVKNPVRRRDVSWYLCRYLGGQQKLITSSLNRKANVHTTYCGSYQELSFHPWCSHLLQYGVLSGRKEFIPCPTHHLILGLVFFKDTSILIQNRKKSTSPKNENVALEKCFRRAPPFETLTALQCQPCDCLLLQYLSHFYQTTK